MNQATLCDRCKKQIATVYYKKTVNGQQTQRHLCAACANQEGLAAEPWADLWASDPFEPLLSQFFLPKATQDQGRCPTCHTTAQQIRRQGRFGCADCYTAFASRLDLSPFSHPQGYRGTLAPQEDEPTQTQPQEPQPQEPQKPDLAQLKKQLSQAVEAEEYEKAAALRDRIRELEKKEDA